MTDRIAALDVIGGPPVPCMVEWAELPWSLFDDKDGTAHLVATTTGEEWSLCKRAPLRLVTVMLGLGHDPLGMVQHALRQKLAGRLWPGAGLFSTATLAARCFDKPWFRFWKQGLNKWVPNAHRYIARTDRMCERHNLALEPGEVAHWRWRTDPYGWSLKTRAGEVLFAVAGLDVDKPLEALAACLEKYNGKT